MQVFSAQIYNQFGKSVQAIKLSRKTGSVFYSLDWENKGGKIFYLLYKHQ